MKWNDFTLWFFLFLCVGVTILFGKQRVAETLFLQKILLDRNLDTISEDSLYASVEGVREDFEPIINQDWLLTVFQAEKDWIFGKGNVNIPVLFLTEKEKQKIFAVSEQMWKEKLLESYEKQDTYFYPPKFAGQTEILRTDEIRENLEREIGATYRVNLPYIEQERGIQKIEKTSLWYFYRSPSYHVGGETRDFFTYSGARGIRKKKMK